jgi:glycine cleavage system H protein
MSEVRYSKEHEWVSLDGEVATVGITKHATEQLGDVVYVELPDAGRALSKDGDAAVVESVKAASDVYAPLSGEVTEANEKLSAEPGEVNADPEGAAWFFKMKISDKTEFDALMTRQQYDAFVEGQ